MRHPLPLVALFAALLCGCQTVFMTGRDQLSLLPEEQEVRLGVIAFQEVLDTEPKSQNAHLTQMVERVGKRIASVAEREDYQWEFVLLARPNQNAFCLPGGKVAVYEGILPVCQNEAGLAVVMSHEIAHAIARHGGERMSHQMAAEGGQWALSRVLGQRDSKKVEMIKSVYGIGTEYGVLLPFSRTQESEADSIGLTLMARAGYDPQEAPRFWERFSHENSSNVPELLSTHPSDETRMRQLSELLPRAMAVYQRTPQRYGLAEQIPMTALQGLAVAPPAQRPASTAPAATALAPSPAATTAPVAAAMPPAVETPATTPASPPVETTGVSVTVAPVVKVERTADPLTNLGAPTVDATVAPAVIQSVAESPAPAATASEDATTTAPVIQADQQEPETAPPTEELVVPDEWTAHEQP
jgi:Zn-dependent protease with chaperone function